MFETPRKERSPHFWRTLIASLALSAGIAVLLIFFLTPGTEEKPSLTGILRSGDPHYEWYREYVGLQNPKVQMGKNIAGHRVVMFSAVIENSGEKTLDVVEIELSFFNYEERVWETVRTPIRPERSNYTPPIEPLEERGFTLYTEKIPQNWLASHAEMELHGFRFVARHRPQTVH